MKNFKILIILIFLQNLLTASMYYGTKNYCIDDYYAVGGRFYYLPSDSQIWLYTTATNQTLSISPNFTYNLTNKRCSPDIVNLLGIQSDMYYFLLALSGLIFSSIITFVILNFLVGL